MTEPVVPPDKKRELGLYRKYNVTRTDGKGAAGEKHDGCDYFVLDLQCDPHAIPAIRAYAASAKADGYHQLAYDLRQRIGDIPVDLNRDPRQPVPREVLERPDAVARPALPAPPKMGALEAALRDLACNCHGDTGDGEGHEASDHLTAGEREVFDQVRRAERSVPALPAPEPPHVYETGRTCWCGESSDHGEFFGAVMRAFMKRWRWEVTQELVDALRGAFQDAGAAVPAEHAPPRCKNCGSGELVCAPCNQIVTGASADEIRREIREGTPDTPERIAMMQRADELFNQHAGVRAAKLSAMPPAEHAPPDTLAVLIPREIAPASWLNGPGYESFRKAYAYAETQTWAIPALAKCSPEELYAAYTALLRGTGFIADALESGSRPALAANHFAAQGLPAKHPDREDADT